MKANLRILLFSLLLTLPLTVLAQTEPTDNNGNGYRNVSTLEHLRWISENPESWNNNFELDNDIDASDTESWNNGAGWSPIGDRNTEFTGTFEGNGYKIDNLFINRPYTSWNYQHNIGLIGYLNGTVQNIGVTNANIIGDKYVGCLVGTNFEGLIINSYSTGVIAGQENVGGLVGDNNYQGRIMNSYSLCSVAGINQVGGLVGINSYLIQHSYSIGIVSGLYDVGGFVGRNEGQIRNCYCRGSSSGEFAVGGLVGWNFGQITNCYSTSEVTANTDAGGLVGRNAHYVGCSFWDIESSGQVSSDGGTGKTTAEMKDLSTYIDSGWNFVFIWAISDDYPYIDFDFTHRPKDTNGNGFINISTLNDLRWLSESGYDLDKDFELDNIIDATETKNWNCGEGWLPLNAFHNIFEGNGYEIDNLFINRPLISHVGLFSQSTGTIQNIGVTDVNSTGYDFVGGLVGSNSGEIRNSYSKGTVYGTDRIIGSLVGGNSGRIRNSYSTGTVSGIDRHIGGLIGQNTGELANSYSTATATGSFGIGGLIGRNSGIVRNCYSAGFVSGTQFVGGLAGSNPGTISCSFWDVETSGQDTSRGAIGKTTAEMKMLSTYIDAGWNFDFIWNIDNDYPFIYFDFSNRPKDKNANGFLNISSLAELRWLTESGYDLDKNWELDNNIDASNTENWNCGEGWLPFLEYSNIFEGNGYEIDNLYINRPEVMGVALFSISRGTIQNIGVTNVNVTGKDRAAGIIGVNMGTLANCYSTGEVYGKGGSVPVMDAFGVLVASNWGLIANCYSMGLVSGKNLTGGLVGQNSGRIRNSYSNSTVIGKKYVGGLVGHNYNGEILNSYSTGEVSGNEWAGGIVGMQYGSFDNVRCSFWDVETSGLDSSVGGTGKTTAEMKSLNTYIDSGWNFDFIWSMDGDYPKIDIDFTYRPTDTDGDGFLNISTLNDLRWLSENYYDLDKNWKLDNNIDASAVETWNCGEGWIPFEPFYGTFEGNEYQISNLTIFTPNLSSLGLFSELSGTIQNIEVVNIIIHGKDNIGGLVGWNNGIITNSGCSGKISGNDFVGGLIGLNKGQATNNNSNVIVSGRNNVGGLIGRNDGSTIINSYSTGMVSGDSYVGGLIGRNYQFTLGSIYQWFAAIIDSYSTGAVSGNKWVGGLSGSNNGSISNCYSTGAVSGHTYVGGLLGYHFNSLTRSYSNGVVNGNDYVGGLIGNNLGQVESCFSTGAVTGRDTVGGLFGSGGQVINTYSIGDVTGNNCVGGLIGYKFMDVSNSYSVGKVIGTGNFVGGFIGQNRSGPLEASFWDLETSGLETSAGGIGKSTVEMKTKSTFTDVDWDFEVIWSIHPDVNDGYPYLLMGNPTSVSDNQADEIEPYNFNVYPNPFAGSLNIEFDLPAEMPISIVLIDNSGKTVKHIHDGMGNAGRNNHIVELTELSSGLYFLILSANGEMLTQKVISVR